MILMVFLFAPTVPSAPRPKNMARTVSSDLRSRTSDHSRRLVWVTSSSMPMVKWFCGVGFCQFLEDAA